MQKTKCFIPVTDFVCQPYWFWNHMVWILRKDLVIFPTFGTLWATQRAIIPRNKRPKFSIIWKFIWQACWQFLHLHFWLKAMYLTLTEINRLWAGGENDGFQQTQTHPGKGGLAATYTSLAALFYTGRCLIQISLSTQ